MDKHDVAHYGMAGLLLLGGGALAHHVAVAPPVLNVKHVAHAGKNVWPPLTDVERAALSQSFKAWPGPRSLVVWCLDPGCDDIAADVAAAAEDAGLEAEVQRSAIAPDGVSVGGPIPIKGAVNPLSHDLAKAVDDGTADRLAPGISVEPSADYFVSFGRKPK